MQATLPKPPGVNHFYAVTSRGGFARTYITKKGLAWIEEAGTLLKQQIKVESPITIPLGVSIEWHSARFGDIDGCIKPTLDLLQKMNIIENDSLILELVVKKFKVHHYPEERMIVEIKTLN